MTIIPLGRALPHGSSHLPADSVGHVNVCLFGVAPRRDWPFHSRFWGPTASLPRWSRETGTRLCSSNPRLTADGSYPLRCPVESRLSSAQPEGGAAIAWLASQRYFTLDEAAPAFLTFAWSWTGSAARHRRTPRPAARSASREHPGRASGPSTWDWRSARGWRSGSPPACRLH